MSRRSSDYFQLKPMKFFEVFRDCNAYIELSSLRDGNGSRNVFAGLTFEGTYSLVFGDSINGMVFLAAILLESQEEIKPEPILLLLGIGFFDAWRKGENIPSVTHFVESNIYDFASLEGPSKTYNYECQFNTSPEEYKVQFGNMLKTFVNFAKTNINIFDINGIYFSFFIFDIYLTTQYFPVIKPQRLHASSSVAPPTIPTSPTFNQNIVNPSNQIDPPSISVRSLQASTIASIQPASRRTSRIIKEPNKFNPSSKSSSDDSSIEDTSTKQQMKPSNRGRGGRQGVSGRGRESIRGRGSKTKVSVGNLTNISTSTGTSNETTGSRFSIQGLGNQQFGGRNSSTGGGRGGRGRTNAATESNSSLSSHSSINDNVSDMTQSLRAEKSNLHFHPCMNADMQQPPYHMNAWYPYYAPPYSHPNAVPPPYPFPYAPPNQSSLPPQHQNEASASRISESRNNNGTAEGEEKTNSFVGLERARQLTMRAKVLDLEEADVDYSLKMASINHQIKLREAQLRLQDLDNLFAKKQR